MISETLIDINNIETEIKRPLNNRELETLLNKVVQCFVDYIEAGNGYNYSKEFEESLISDLKGIQEYLK